MMISSPDTQQIVVVNDHPLICSAIATALQAILNRPAVHVAESLNEGCQKCQNLKRIDLVLLDLNMLDSEGGDTLWEILRLLPSTPVLVMSDNGDDLLVREAFRMGVKGFVSKTSSVPTLSSAVHAVLRGERFASPDYSYLLQETGEEHLPASPMVAGRQGEASLLTRRQMDVLILVSKGHSNKHIARVLGISSGTVKNHISDMCKAFGVGRREALVMRVFGQTSQYLIEHESVAQVNTPYAASQFKGRRIGGCISPQAEEKLT